MERELKKKYLERMMNDYKYYRESGFEAPLYLTVLNHMAIDLHGDSDISVEIIEAFSKKVKEYEKGVQINEVAR